MRMSIRGRCNFDRDNPSKWTTNRSAGVNSGDNDVIRACNGKEKIEKESLAPAETNNKEEEEYNMATIQHRHDQR